MHNPSDTAADTMVRITLADILDASHDEGYTDAELAWFRSPLAASMGQG